MTINLLYWEMAKMLIVLTMCSFISMYYDFMPPYVQ